jgi:hypothetical protein
MTEMTRAVGWRAPAISVIEVPHSSIPLLLCGTKGATTRIEAESVAQDLDWVRRPEEGHRTPKEGQERRQGSTWGSEASEGQSREFQERRNRPTKRDNGDERRSTFAERRQGAKHFGSACHA